MWARLHVKWDYFKTWWPAPLGAAGLLLGLVHVGPQLADVTLTLIAAVFGAYVTIKVDIGKLQAQVGSIDREVARLVYTVEGLRRYMGAPSQDAPRSDL
jgi:hypothetical protein